MQTIICPKCGNDITNIIANYQRNSGLTQFYIVCTFCDAELALKIPDGIVPAKDFRNEML